VLLVDVLKGYVACRFIGDWGARLFGGSDLMAMHEYFLIVAGFCAVLGHNFTCWLHFKGGKGIATSAGVLLALFPKALPVVLVIWALVFAVSRYVSLASVTAAFWLPIFVWVFGYSGQRVVIAVIMAALAIYQHKSNLQRLIAGTENRFGERKPDSAAAPPPK
jgi:glycerol-3-phosphate acyltransferase PlsY